MPTGYTYGIIEGSTKTFKDFALQCSRAFILHMRDEPADSEYKERVPSDYHSDRIKEAKRCLKTLEATSDSDLIQQEVDELAESNKYHLDRIDKILKDQAKLEFFMLKAKAYKPPTKTHKGISEFMINQLKITIDSDCDVSYHTGEIDKIHERKVILNAKEIRDSRIKEYNRTLEYSTKENKEDVDRCIEHNQWYKDFVNSL